MPTTRKSVQIHRQKIKTAQMNADRETKGEKTARSNTEKETIKSNKETYVNRPRSNNQCGIWRKKHPEHFAQKEHGHCILGRSKNSELFGGLWVFIRMFTL